MTVVVILLDCGLIWYGLFRALDMMGAIETVVPGKRIGRKCGSERW